VGEWLATLALTTLLCYMAAGRLGFVFQVIAICVLGFCALGASELSNQQRRRR
jgi:hypothetical protein